MILSIDIGGTNTRLALFEGNNGTVKQIDKIKIFPTNEFNSIESILSEFEKINDFSLDIVKSFAIAVPGPVTDSNIIRMVNVNWTIDKKNLNLKYNGQNILYLNDFAAQALGCLLLKSDEKTIIKYGIKSKSKDFAVVGAGTGLGHCFVKYINPEKFVIVPSEAGHINFPFTSDEMGFLDFLSSKNIKRPTGNDIISGKGLSLLYEYLTGEKLNAEDVLKNIDATSETVKMFAKFSARAVKNYALSVLTEGRKLFLSGGVFIKNEHLLNNEYFIEEFEKCSLNTNFLKDVEILLLKNEYSALKGAAYFAIIKS